MITIDETDRQARQFANNLDRVLRELEKKALAIVSGAYTGDDAAFIAGTILESRGAMLQALRDAGFYELAQAHIDEFPKLVESVRMEFAAQDLPDVRFTTADAETFRQLAEAELDGLEMIGEEAIDELRMDLYRTAISGQPISSAVEIVREVVGDKLKRHAYTYANTGRLFFSGQVIQRAGEELGADKWRVVGPDDEVTRPVCDAALDRPVRTKEEWIRAGYWGGTPGGWNCRHQLFPYFGKLKDVQA